MDLPVHNQILWHACLLAKARLGSEAIADPIHHFPLMVRGSWFNDTNQVTPFTDLFSNAPDPTQPYRAETVHVTRAFFDAYWEGEQKLVLERLGGFDGDAAVEAAKLCATIDGAADFGSYMSHDHLDVLSEEAATHEYSGGGRVAETVRGSLQTATSRLTLSSTADPSVEGRTLPARVSTLGRALHTIADFFAHSNYVELLLWALAEQGKLPASTVALLDCRPGSLPFDPALFGAHPLDGAPKREHIFLYAPVTPQKKVEADGLMVPALWQHEAAKDTPLASCVFDKQDTAYSMLHLCAHHLESEKDGKTSEQQLDFLFSIMDVSGIPLAGKTLRLFAGLQTAVSDLFNLAGRAARNALAGWLQSKGDEPGRKNGDVFKLSADLLRKYEGAEANDWAQAGRLKYLAHAVQKGMGRGLAQQLAADAKAKRLPHHTLLSKDHPSARPDEQLRFALACTLATEVTARVLVWHFGKAAPTRDGWKAVRDAYLTHPSDQLGTIFHADKVASLATRCMLVAWPTLLDPAQPLEVLK